MKKQSRRTGTIEWHGDHWDVRPTGADGKRGGRVCQPVGMTEARARDKAQHLTDKAALNGTVAAVPVPAELAPVEPTPDHGPSIEAWCALWCEDRERRGLSSVGTDRGRLTKWILPRFKEGDVYRPMKLVSSAELRAFVEDLDARIIEEQLGWKTAKNVWGLVTKMFKDSVKSKTAALRVRTDNPALEVAGPDEGVIKSKAYLYPSEFLAMMNCARIPIRWRRLFASAVYLYTRAGEFEALALTDADLVTRRVHVHRSIDRTDGQEKETKTNNPRYVPVEPEYLPLLERLMTDRHAAPRLFAMPPLCDLAPRLRKYLRWAGVTRPELFANDRTRKQITFHDLRATGITWMAIRGDEPMRIMRRAGHENMSTTMGYVREAESLEYLRGDVFPPLPASMLLPETLPETAAYWATLRNHKGKKVSPAGFEPASLRMSGLGLDKVGPSVQANDGPDVPPKSLKRRRRVASGQPTGVQALASRAGLAAPERAREDSIADMIREGLSIALLAGGTSAPDLESAMVSILHRATELLTKPTP